MGIKRSISLSTPDFFGGAAISANGNYPADEGHSVHLGEDHPAHHTFELIKNGTISAGTVQPQGRLSPQGAWQDIGSALDLTLDADLYKVIKDMPIGYLRLVVASLAGGGTVDVRYVGKGSL